MEKWVKSKYTYWFKIVHQKIKFILKYKCIGKSLSYVFLASMYD